MQQLGLLRVKLGAVNVIISQQDPNIGIHITTCNATDITPVFTSELVYPFEVPLEISLNNQQYTTDGVRFTYFGKPTL